MTAFTLRKYFINLYFMINGLSDLENNEIYNFVSFFKKFTLISKRFQMDFQEVLERKKSIQKILLDFLENDSDIEENYQKIISILKDQKIKESQPELKEFLYLLSKICKYHNRSNSFSSKMQQILKSVQNDIKQTFSNSEIFDIFKSNKDILLFLLKEKIIVPDKSIIKEMKSDKYKPFQYNQFFSDFLNDKKVASNDKSDDFEENRKTGENDSYVCQLIRTDSIDQFISHVNKENLSTSTEIETSLFETNLFLLKNKVTLIEYAAFFGSTQIFRYLYLNKAKISPFLWNFAIHGNNPELINFMVENKIKLNNNSYYDCIIESIKCHHVEMTNFIINNLYQKRKNDDSDFEIQSLKSHNYSFFQMDSNDKQVFYNLCKYNYPSIVSLLMKTKRIPINTKIFSDKILFIDVCIQF